MADFQSQAMGLTGLTIDASSTTPSRAEFSTFLNDGVIDVTNRWLLVKPQDIDSFTREGAEQTSNGFNPGTNKIVSVIRESGTDGEWYPCSKKPINLQYLVTDVDSLHYASKYNPVYMITQNRNVHVYPAPSGAGNDGFKVLYVNYSPEETDGTALQHSSSGIKWFPDNKVYLVVLYASMRSVQAKMADTTITDLTVTVVPPDVPVLASTSISFSQAAPTYTKPTVSLTAAPTIGNLTISVSAPTAPSLSTITFSSIDSAVDATLVAAATSTTLGGTTTPPTYDTGVATTALGEANDFIDSDEDVELANAKLAEVQALMQDELNEFNQENIAFQAGVQEAMAEFQSANQIAISNAERSQNRQLQNSVQDMKVLFDTNTQVIQKYGAELQLYQAEVAAQVQEYTQNLQADGVGYQWLQGQYVALKAEYDAAFMIAAPKPQPQQQARR